MGDGIDGCRPSWRLPGAAGFDRINRQHRRPVYLCAGNSNHIVGALPFDFPHRLLISLDFRDGIALPATGLFPAGKGTENEAEQHSNKADDKDNQEDTQPPAAMAAAIPLIAATVALTAAAIAWAAARMTCTAARATCCARRIACTDALTEKAVKPCAMV